MLTETIGREPQMPTSATGALIITSVVISHTLSLLHHRRLHPIILQVLTHDDPEDLSSHRPAALTELRKLREDLRTRLIASNCGQMFDMCVDSLLDRLNQVWSLRTQIPELL